jgi:thymidylate synthase
MRQYLELVEHVLENGQGKKTRGIHGVKSTFGYQLRFDFRRGFPIITTKKMPIKWMLTELLWFISGRCENTEYLKQLSAEAGMTKGVNIWDEFADEEGNLGPIYGNQWRRWPDYNGGYIDQLQNVIEEIKTMPNSKAMLVSAWNPGQMKEMRLPPCHAFFQFNVLNEKLRCQLYQRSSDVFLGLPFNITQYALLTMMVAQVTGLEARELIVTIGDAHIYNNHKEAAREQLTRTPYRLPIMKINPKVKNIDDFKVSDFELVGYQSHAAIKTDIVVI